MMIWYGKKYYGNVLVITITIYSTFSIVLYTSTTHSCTAEMLTYNFSNLLEMFLNST